MGMDYVWSGSASYPRFDKELGKVAEILGAQVRKTSQGIQYYKYYEPILDIVVGWLNQPFNDLTEEETKIVWEAVRQHPEIEEISWQIWNELEKCVALETGWHIY